MSSRKNIILVICGSAAEWMIKKIVSNKGGLHNRLTRPPINLMPFTLKQTEQGLTQKEIFDKVKSMSSGGGAVLVLEELENCGFIYRVPDFGKKTLDID